jgi:catechol 2,3-dioxygenase-like lactoylglutathione lyase family enzyme
MLHHVSVGVRDVADAAAFYDTVLGALGYKRTAQYLPYAIGYGEGTSEFWIQVPADQGSPSPGNGVHIGFSARSRDAIHSFHEKALAHGGTDNGAPGPRPDYGPDYYGAFVRDPYGNKLEATLDPAAKKRARAGRPAKLRRNAAKRAAARTKTKAKPANARVARNAKVSKNSKVARKAKRKAKRG